MSCEFGRFSLRDKEYVHKRAGNRCEFPGEACERPNTGIVNHLTGAFEGMLDRRDPIPMQDPDMNAFMLCDVHSALHDAQERFQVSCLKAERWRQRGGTLFERRQHNISHRKRR